MRQIRFPPAETSICARSARVTQFDAGTEHQRLSAPEIQPDLCMGPLLQLRHDATPVRTPARPRCPPASHRACCGRPSALVQHGGCARLIR